MRQFRILFTTSPDLMTGLFVSFTLERRLVFKYFCPCGVLSSMGIHSWCFQKEMWCCFSLSHPSVWRFHRGLSSASPVKCCRTLKLKVLENTAAALRHQFPFLSPKRDVRGSVAETKRMMKFLTGLKQFQDTSFSLLIKGKGVTKRMTNSD